MTLRLRSRIGVVLVVLVLGVTAFTTGTMTLGRRFATGVTAMLHPEIATPSAATFTAEIQALVHVADPDACPVPARVERRQPPTPGYWSIAVRWTAGESGLAEQVVNRCIGTSPRLSSMSGTAADTCAVGRTGVIGSCWFDEGVEDAPVTFEGGLDRHEPGLRMTQQIDAAANTWRTVRVTRSADSSVPRYVDVYVV